MLATGFTLFETMITIVILGILVALGLPAFTEWLQNAQIRTYADSTLAGLQMARAEAVRRNTQVEFLFTDTDPTPANINTATANTAGPNWVVRVFQPGGVYAATDFIQGRARAEATQNVIVDASQGSIRFNGQGRVVPLPAANITVDFTSASAAATRPLRITVSPAGQVRLCDPALPSTNVQAC